METLLEVANVCGRIFPTTAQAGSYHHVMACWACHFMSKSSVPAIFVIVLQLLPFVTVFPLSALDAERCSLRSYILNEPGFDNVDSTC